MKYRFYLIPFLIFFSFVSFSCGGGGGGDSEAVVENPPPVIDLPIGRVWTVAEILAEAPTGGAGGEAKCGGEGGFKRCICPGEVPGYVRYRPSVLECNGNAAAILSGRLLDAFSIVVRDTQNRDRWPAAGSGFGGCSFETANADSPPNSCSAFKVQNKFLAGNDSIKVHCFGASGYSDIFSDVARLTVKLTDDPFSNSDDVERYCLSGPTIPLN